MTGNRGCSVIVYMDCGKKSKKSRGLVEILPADDWRGLKKGGPGRKGLSEERDEFKDLVKRGKRTLRLESRRERWIERGGEGELGSCERGITRFLVFCRERDGSEWAETPVTNKKLSTDARHTNTLTHAQFTLGNGGGLRSRKDFIDEQHGKLVIFVCVHSYSLLRIVLAGTGRTHGVFECFTINTVRTCCFCFRAFWWHWPCQWWRLGGDS